MPSVIVRPSADATYKEFTTKVPSPPITHYDAVDDETPDENTSYIGTDPTAVVTQKDSFTKPACGIDPLQPISNVRILNRVYARPFVEGGSGSTRTLLRSGATNVFGSLFEPEGVYFNNLTDYAVSPFTGLAWTVAEVDGLEIGVEGATAYRVGEGYSHLRCTQVYLEITYGVVGVAVSQGDGLIWIVAFMNKWRPRKCLSPRQHGLRKL